jgi:hypothetical protein
MSRDVWWLYRLRDDYWMIEHIEQPLGDVVQGDTEQLLLSHLVTPHPGVVL